MKCRDGCGRPVATAAAASATSVAGGGGRGGRSARSAVGGVVGSGELLTVAFWLVRLQHEAALVLGDDGILTPVQQHLVAAAALVAAHQDSGDGVVDDDALSANERDGGRRLLGSRARRSARRGLVRLLGGGLPRFKLLKVLRVRAGLDDGRETHKHKRVSSREDGDQPVHLVRGPLLVRAELRAAERGLRGQEPVDLVLAPARRCRRGVVP